MSFWELLVVLLVALLVLGPTKLTDLAVRMGRMTRRARQIYGQVKSEINAETHATEGGTRGETPDSATEERPGGSGEAFRTEDSRA